MFTKTSRSALALTILTAGLLGARADAAVIGFTFDYGISSVDAPGLDTFVPEVIAGQDGLDSFLGPLTLSFDTDDVTTSVSGDTATYTGAISISYGQFSDTSEFTLLAETGEFGGVPGVELLFLGLDFSSGDTSIDFSIINETFVRNASFDLNNVETIVNLPEFSLNVEEIFVYREEPFFGTDIFGPRVPVDFVVIEADPIPVPAAAFLLAPVLLGGAALRRRAA